MAPHSKDLEATSAMHFLDPRSKACINGAHFYYGQDAMNAYEEAYNIWKLGGRVCDICGHPVTGKPDWEHTIPRGNHGENRDDHPRNRRFTHSMFDPKNSCHRDKHGREPRWSKKQ